MQISTYTGAVVNGRGATKSADTLVLEGALKACVDTQVPQRIHVEDSDDRRRIVYRLRNLATQNKVSCSLGAPADNPKDIVIVKVEPREGSPLLPEPPKKVSGRRTAPPQGRTTRK